MTADPDRVFTEIDARGVARVTLNRPQAHNAMDAAMIAKLTLTAHNLAQQDAVRAVVLQATGKSFCAGGDLGWMRSQIDAKPEVRATEARKLAMMLKAWDQLSKPVIAAVQGNAFGGGVGLMSVADVALGVSGARFGLTEVRLGLIPATIGPYVVACMGAARAREVFFSGRLFDAVEARRLGLVSRVVEADGLEDAVEAEILPYLSAAPGAVGAAKRLVHTLAPTASDAQIDASISALVAQWDGDEAPDGIAAFFDKRPPPWARKD